MITFEEYSLLESFIGSDNFQILLEKNLGSKINKDIKFGIVMATHDMTDGRANKTRAEHMTTPGVLKEALNSVKAQKFKNWKIYLTADKYDNDEEIKSVIKDIIPDNQIQYKNRSTPGERDNKKWSTKQIRFTAGCGALNDSLSMAKKDGCDYIVRIDHDDKWAPNHLELIAKAYSQFPDLGFVFTRSKKKVTARNTDKKIFMQPQKDYELKLNNKGYGPNDTSHSAVSWRPSITGNLTYRNPDQQKNTAPKLKGAPTGSGGVLPADWDMFKRVMNNVRNKNKNYMYIPKTTSFYRNREGKF
jgi:glycosyltransferase involved in cell wall biosynthesis|tara:strand:+ start:1018 stop:1923 length:906 start_codon:yes stop_codon:yes gene_type:complete